MKISELDGVLLDYWVAKIQGNTFELNGKKVALRAHGDIHDFSPSTNWAQGGPIIEKEGITIVYRTQEEDGPVETGWRAVYELSTAAFSGEGRIASYLMSGPTPLVAAMRACIASRLGEEVPDELGTQP